LMWHSALFGCHTFAFCDSCYVYWCTFAMWQHIVYGLENKQHIVAIKRISTRGYILEHVLARFSIDQANWVMLFFR
jgi:hypothetical protein